MVAKKGNGDASRDTTVPGARGGPEPWCLVVLLVVSSVSRLLRKVGLMDCRAPIAKGGGLFAESAAGLAPGSWRGRASELIEVSRFGSEVLLRESCVFPLSRSRGLAGAFEHLGLGTRGGEVVFVNTSPSRAHEL